MLVWDFPDTAVDTMEWASVTIQRGLAAAFMVYPFLSGFVGPSDSNEQGHLQLKYGHQPELCRTRPDMYKAILHDSNDMVVSATWMVHHPSGPGSPGRHGLVANV